MEVKNICHGENSCQFLASNNILGNPCGGISGTLKCLKIEYVCISGKLMTNPLQKDAILLKCRESNKEENQFSCSKCDKIFCKPDQLKRHNKIHTMKHSCTDCGKRFYDTTKLRIHERSHTQEKPFNCDMCKKGFSDKGNMKRHEKSCAKEKTTQV